MGQGAGPVYGTGRPRKWDGIKRVKMEELDYHLGPGDGTGLEGWGL